MNLAIFDVDGTLTQTSAVDGACFERAFAEGLGLAGFSTDWSTYRHATDSGIAEEACVACWGRPPVAEEMDRARRRFLDLLAEEWERSPASFAEVPGAASALARLSAEPGWELAIATGCWRDSAVMKLRLGGFPLDAELAAVPLASADDAVARIGIMERAVALAAETHGRSSFDRVVYVGDALWDVRACAELGLPLVGVGRGERKERLHRAGVSHVLEDYEDYGRVRRYLEEAAVPGTFTHVAT